MNKYGPTVDLKVNVGHYELYFMVQWFYVTDILNSCCLYWPLSCRGYLISGAFSHFSFLLFLHFHSCSSFFSDPLFHLCSCLSSLLLSLFSFSLGDDTKWPMRVDVSSNPNAVDYQHIAINIEWFKWAIKSKEQACPYNWISAHSVFYLLETRNVTMHLQKYFITKTCLYNFDPLKPHFYIVKLGYTLFFLFLLKT